MPNPKGFSSGRVSKVRFRLTVESGNPFIPTHKEQASLRDVGFSGFVFYKLLFPTPEQQESAANVRKFVCIAS
jgi:hypothetical protein